MKRILALMLVLLMVLTAAVACKKDPEPTPDPDPHTHSATKTEQVDATATADGVKAYWYCAGCSSYFSDAACTTKIADLAAWKTGDGKIPATGTEDPGEGGETTDPTNQGTLKAGVYKATIGMSAMAPGMSINATLTLKADGTFTLTDAAGADKGNGTWALTETCYTLTFGADKATTFVVADATSTTLSITSRLFYGTNGFDLASVDGGAITFTFESDVPADPEQPGEGGETGETYTIAAGTYVGTAETPAMGGLTYYFNVTLGADGTFTYAVVFKVQGQVMNGATATGTYTVEGNVFTFTPAEGEAIVGTLTAENTLKISLKASTMGSTPYEVVLTQGSHVVLYPDPTGDDMADDEFAPAV